MINGIIAAKLQSLDEVLNEVKSLGAVSAEQFRGEVLAYVQAY